MSKTKTKIKQSVYKLTTANPTGKFQVTYVTCNPRRKKRKTLSITSGQSQVNLTGAQINALKRLFLKEKQINRKSA